MADIIKEVDEADRQARLEEFWEAYRSLIYGGIALIITSVAGWEGYQWNKNRAETARMTIFEDALALQDAGDYEGAAEIFEKLFLDKTSLSPLAGHYLANIQESELGAPDKALEVLAAVNDPSSVFGQLAMLKYAHASADTSDLATLENTLLPLTGRETALASLAIELLANKAFEEGDYVRADNYYDLIDGRENLPNGLKFRLKKARAALKHLLPTQNGQSQNDAETEAINPKLLELDPVGAASDTQGLVENSVDALAAEVPREDVQED